MKGSSKFMNKDFGFSGILGGKQNTNPGLTLIFFYFFLYPTNFSSECWRSMVSKPVIFFQIFTIGIESKYVIVTDHLSPAM